MMKSFGAIGQSLAGRRRLPWTLLTFAVVAVLVAVFGVCYSGVAMRRHDRGRGLGRRIMFKVRQGVSSYSLAFSKGRIQLFNHGRLALVHGDAGAELWSLESQEPMYLRTLVSAGVFAAAPLGDRVLCHDRASVRLVAAADGRVLSEIPLQGNPNGGPARCNLATSGELFAVEVRGAIEVRASSSGSLVRSIPVPDRLGPDGVAPRLKELYFLGDDYLKTTWADDRVVSPQLVRMSDGKVTESRAQSLLPNGEFLRCIGCSAPAVWRISVESLDGRLLRDISPDPPALWLYPLVAASGKRIVLHGTDRPNIEIHSTATGARVGGVEATRTFGWNIDTSADGDRVAVLLSDGTVEVLDVP